MQSRYNTNDLRICGTQEVIPPEQVQAEFPVDDKAAETTIAARQGIHRILAGEDDRMLVVIGPCSIHDPEAALEYARRLREIQPDFEKDLLLVMRVYFEKPRTTVGWKGLINDPDLDGSFNINKGLKLARKLLLELNQLGVAAATEYLDLITPQYVSDLISWGAIGARTTESQVHRELASGLSCPVGFKNATDGTIKVAIDAIRAAQCPHHFLSLTSAGRSAIFSTTGNEDCHIILRGGKKPNYDQESVAAARQALIMSGLPPRIMIDLSHANSGKCPEVQPRVASDVARQVAAGNTDIMGAMVESHLIGGRQDVVEGNPLVFGQSITDGCLAWEDSITLLQELAQAVQSRRILLAASQELPS